MTVKRRRRGTWYAAQLLFQSSGPEARPLCEERVVLVRAASEASALRRVLAYGNAEQHSYLNVYRERVKWTFVGVESLTDVIEQSMPENGAPWDVWCRFRNRTKRSLKEVRKERMSSSRRVAAGSPRPLSRLGK
jgi:hypothetical protein